MGETGDTDDTDDTGDTSGCSMVESKAVAVVVVDLLVVAVVAAAGLGSLGSFGTIGTFGSTTTCLLLHRRSDPLYQSGFRGFFSGSEGELDRKDGKEREEENIVARKDLLEVILGNI